MIENGTRDTIYDIRNLLHLIDAFQVPRALLLPVILGNPGAFPDRRIALTEAGRAAYQPGGYKPGEIMHMIAGKLRARGLEIAERTSGDDITEFTATNPADPGKGTVHISYDGYVTWESLTEINGDIADIVTSLLGPYSPPGEFAGDSSGATENTRPPREKRAHLVSASTGRGRAG